MTKRSLICILSFFLMIFIGCQENNLTGKLQGKWQLKTVEHSGSVINVDTVWYNFQSEPLFMYQIFWEEKDSFMNRYGMRIHSGDNIMSIELDNSSDVPLSKFLPYTDWETGKREFVIDKISGKHLTLRSQEKVYFFTKFE